MNAQDVALWIGIASSIGGAAVGYGTLTEKVSALESNTNASLLESRLTKLEVRIEDNDIGRIGKEIETVRGETATLRKRLAGKMKQCHAECMENNKCHDRNSGTENGCAGSENGSVPDCGTCHV